MTYSYRILSPGLSDTANAAIEWFIREWGLKKKNISVEQSFDPEINFRPTFVVRLDDGHLLCIEVSQNVYSNTLDSVVLACLNKGLPIKLLVATPRDPNDGEYSAKLKAAKRNGVGILEVDDASGTMVQTPLSLSLAGVRPIQLSEFPARYRQQLQHAHQMFRDGEPSKACSLVYDELEACCRRLAEKCVAKGYWTPPKGFKLATGAWAKLMSDLDKGISRNNPATKKLTTALMARIIGVTSHRNESGHKSNSLKDQINRDRALRTRFESGVDLLREFIEATKPFRI